MSEQEQAKCPSCNHSLEIDGADHAYFVCPATRGGCGEMHDRVPSLLNRIAELERENETLRHSAQVRIDTALAEEANRLQERVAELERDLSQLTDCGHSETDDSCCLCLRCVNDKWRYELRKRVEAVRLLTEEREKVDALEKEYCEGNEELAAALRQLAEERSERKSDAAVLIESANAMVAIANAAGIDPNQEPGEIAEAALLWLADARKTIGEFAELSLFAHDGRFPMAASMRCQKAVEWLENHEPAEAAKKTVGESATARPSE